MSISKWPTMWLPRPIMHRSPMRTTGSVTMVWPGTIPAEMLTWGPTRVSWPTWIHRSPKTAPVGKARQLPGRTPRTGGPAGRRDRWRRAGPASSSRRGWRRWSTADGGGWASGPTGRGAGDRRCPVDGRRRSGVRHWSGVTARAACGHPATLTDGRPTGPRGSAAAARPGPTGPPYSIELPCARRPPDRRRPSGPASVGRASRRGSDVYERARPSYPGRGRGPARRHRRTGSGPSGSSTWPPAPAS